ncbi:haptoglobin [Cololabis saira]|uniref:haptoglobin n=1 Tax=Cololabis saira TaxID=129043 RepID=UPI002AD57AC1|nr:haptoglobin [Cololabis saira]
MVHLSDSESGGGYAGGALISEHWVLTAGRNLFVWKSRQDIGGKDPAIPKVYLGILHKAEANASREVAVEKVFLHPGFQNQSDWDNNLALIKLQHPVIMDDKVAPIPLPERSQHLDSIVEGSGVITGWGWNIYLTAGKSLKRLVLPLANLSDCKSEYERISFTPAVDNNMFCTGPTKYKENVCSGDAGSALAVRDAQTGDIYAAGILSYDKCCTRYNYGVYMKISSYLPWIHSVIRGDTEKSSSLRSNAMSKMFP